MSKTKSYNQIIFLTTLSVYLGLVLVGASPQVLAQAALTSKFEIKDQIEKKDDLDKKPKENDLISSEINKLVSELNILSEKERFSWDSISHYKVSDLSYDEWVDDPYPRFFHKSIEWGWDNDFYEEFALTIEKITFEVFENILKHKAKLGSNEKYSQSIDFSTLIESKTIKIDLKITNKNKSVADFIYNEYKKELQQTLSNQGLPKQKLVAENTTVTAENNQVFIVTRLPRAAIDSLTKQ
jgi:hypothetical protein